MNSPHILYWSKMMSIDCPYGKLMRQGSRSWIQCEKNNMSCMFQRYCTYKRCVVFSTQATQCKLRNNE